MSNPILKTFRDQDAVIQGLSAAIVRVRELHKPEDFNGTLICPECESLGYLTRYPCSTIKALDGDIK